MLFGLLLLGGKLGDLGQLHPSVGEVEHLDVKPVGVQLQLFAVGGNHRQLGKDQAAQSIELLVLGEGDVQSLRQLDRKSVV